MPDNTDKTPIRPPGWGEAFAALPLESPPADGWQRVAAELPSTRGRTRWPLWVATAAALAVVAIVPLKLLPTDPAPAPLRDPAPAATTPTPSTRDHLQVAAEPTVRAPSTTVEERPDTTSEPAKAFAQQDQRQNEPTVTTTRKPDSETTSAHVGLVDADAPATVGASGANATTASEVTTDNAELERLYAESAQLEALLALARDDSVSTGAADTLASSYDAQLASIDAALIQPGIDDAARTRLWQDRVDVLQHAATFESTRRMLAAQGERYDAMLVSID